MLHGKTKANTAPCAQILPRTRWHEFVYAGIDAHRIYFGCALRRHAASDSELIHPYILRDQMMSQGL